MVSLASRPRADLRFDESIERIASLHPGHAKVIASSDGLGWEGLHLEVCTNFGYHGDEQSEVDDSIRHAGYACEGPRRTDGIRSAGVAAWQAGWQVAGSNALAVPDMGWRAYMYSTFRTRGDRTADLSEHAAAAARGRQRREACARGAATRSTLCVW